MKIEWPTLTLGVLLGAAFCGLVLSYGDLPAAFTVPAGALLLAWYGSFQHETIHGHPTPWPRLNALLGGLPLGLWLPYEVYRRSHLAHHRNELTHPTEDPESFYVSVDTWDRLSPVARGLLRANQTLAGRLIVGPAITIATTWRRIVRELREERALCRDVFLHVSMVAALLTLTVRAGVPLTVYLFGWVYPALSLTLLRSFAEHRADASATQRSVVVEAAGPFGLLFLNNNLHEVHHRYPHLPWYALPGRYRREREELLHANGGYVFRGYGALVRRYLFRPRDEVRWPVAR